MENEIAKVDAEFIVSGEVNPELVAKIKEFGGKINELVDAVNGITDIVDRLRGQ
jgi:hypothetical protein